MAKIKFACQCGKTLTADDTAAGKKAKCPNCGQILKIPSMQASSEETSSTPAERSRPSASPTPTSAPPTKTKPRGSSGAHTPPPANKSIWDEDLEGDVGADSPELELPATPSPGPAAKGRSGIFAKLAPRPWWLNWVVFLTYVTVVWLVSRSSPMGSLLLVMPAFFLAVLIFFFGGVWYFLVLSRDDPAQATALFFALLKSFVLGRSATATGYEMGKKNRGKPANPSHARPIAIMKFGALGFAFSLGATLIVGILLGTWTKENFRRARFRDLQRSQPSMQRPEPEPSTRFR